MEWLTPQLCISMCALVTAVSSLYVAVSNYRRSNYPVLRLCQFETDYTSSEENNSALFARIQVTLQNFGIPLSKLSMSLKFKVPDGVGTCAYSLGLGTDDGTSIRDGQFAKGMYVRFILKSYKLDSIARSWMSRLICARSQHTSVQLFADKYLVWQHRLHDRFWWIKSKWNWMAVKWNRLWKQDVRVDESGKIKLTSYCRLPLFRSDAWHVDQFVRFLADEAKRRSNAEASGLSHSPLLG
ncbi:hypothetical protein PX52LOC_04714 [Limnoglobus roseus]|uniref:Uncharacterized protein n=1 Tax=Limnoglobus roseus TaxID=2598579 RepID=A0A5C1AGF2_9BACT|nr:hypothetical protein PX52LOC_04714 [Limnoglobus roseus]